MAVGLGSIFALLLLFLIFSHPLGLRLLPLLIMMFFVIRR